MKRYKITTWKEISELLMHVLWNYVGSHIVTSALFLSLQHEPKEILYQCKCSCFTKFCPFLFALWQTYTNKLPVAFHASSIILSIPFVLQDDVCMKANLMHLSPYYVCPFPGWIWACSCAIVSFSCKCWIASQISRFASCLVLAALSSAFGWVMSFAYCNNFFKFPSTVSSWYSST